MQKDLCNKQIHFNDFSTIIIMSMYDITHKYAKPHTKIFEPCHEKTGFLHMIKTKQKVKICCAVSN